MAGRRTATGTRLPIPPITVAWIRDDDPSPDLPPLSMQQQEIDTPDAWAVGVLRRRRAEIRERAAAMATATT